ncbi:MAG: HEAT repeat domain-containing protein, partial [Persicimonas sp.]
KKARDRIILSLGRRQSDRARSRLLDLAQEADAFDLRQTAVRALGFYRDEELLEMLRAWRSDAPPRLRSALDQTTSMIERRLGIENTGRDIDALLEEDFEDGPGGDFESPTGDDASD